MQNARMRIPAVEFEAASHCNLRCEGCNHFSPFAKRGFVSPEAIERDLRVLSKFMHVRILRLVGGEPLLHPGLLDLLRIARDSGLGDRLSMFTNGLLLPRQPEEFWQYMDQVELSLYPGFDPPGGLKPLQTMARRYNVDLRIGRRSCFMIPAVDFPISNRRLVRSIFQTCVMARYCHAIKDGRLFRCSVSQGMDYYLAALGYQTDFTHTDSLPIEDRPDMAQRLRAFLRSHEPLGACRFCLGSSGLARPHRQLTREEMQQPTREISVADALDSRHLRNQLRLRQWWPLIRRLPRRLRQAVWRVLGAAPRVTTGTE